MDWIRIGAFAILILYHVGMVFVPWSFHAKVSPTYDWTAVPMLAISPWRLTLLFLVSGYASRALLGRWRSAGRFVAHRTTRLLVPLAFGILVVVPPQPWVELVTQHGYRASYWQFWTHDYFRFGSLDGIVLPTWNHLWFVAYLWLYTLALGLLAALPAWSRTRAAFDRVFGGVGVVLVPLAWLLVTQVIAFQRWSDSHDVWNDGVAHLAYFPAFLFGFGLGGSERAMAAIVRWWKAAAILAIASYGVTAAIEVRYPGMTRPPQWIADLSVWVRQPHTWGAIVALVGVAEAHLNRDHRWRATLTEAVFPFYIVHQSAIVLGVWWLLPLALPAAAEFTALVAITLAACWAFYLGGRQLASVRPLIGLRPTLATRAQPATGEPTI